MNQLNKNTITANETAKILKCSRGNLDRLTLKGLLKPIPTVFPKLYFDLTQVIELSKKISSKKVL